jgi:uncharacterized protein (UPF0297 family)
VRLEQVLFSHTLLTPRVISFLYCSDEEDGVNSVNTVVGALIVLYGLYVGLALWASREREVKRD